MKKENLSPDVENVFLQDILDVLQEQLFLGGVDPQAYAAIKGSVLVCQQRLSECNISDAVALYRLLKKVIS